MERGGGAGKDSCPGGEKCSRKDFAKGKIRIHTYIISLIQYCHTHEILSITQKLSMCQQYTIRSFI
jgi:hypothetical protein